MRIHRVLNRLCLIAVLWMLFMIPEFGTEAQPQKVAFQSFTDEFETYNTELWHKADGWTNGDPFACGWRENHAILSGGTLTLRLDDNDCPGECSGQSYASGEYRSNNFYQYGTYNVVMKAAASSGVVSSFFIYTGPSDGNPHDEIDIEILGKDPSKLQTNYFTNGTGGHETVINLGFDASAAFHTYTIIWMPDAIEWYVDGILKHTEDGSRGALPETPGRIMMNLWPGTSHVDDWLGAFVYATPLRTQYDSVSFTPLNLPNKTYLPLMTH